MEEVAMSRKLLSCVTPRRVATALAAVALAAVLSGCVVYPAPGYYGYHRYYHHDDDDGR
jgi:hypothetical protein